MCHTSTRSTICHYVFDENPIQTILHYKTFTSISDVQCFLRFANLYNKVLSYHVASHMSRPKGHTLKWKRDAKSKFAFINNDKLFLVPAFTACHALLFAMCHTCKKTYECATCGLFSNI